MLNTSHNSSSAHQVLDQTIQSIDVIEDWNLSHHLSCVIKYVERASHTNSILENLKKAEWYLDRAWPKGYPYHQDEFMSQQVQLGPVRYSPQAVCDNWKLSDLLCSTLINIFFSRGRQSPLLRTKVLNAALECLREEIKFLEQREALKSPLWVSSTTG